MLNLPWITMCVVNTFGTAVVRIALGKLRIAGAHVARSVLKHKTMFNLELAMIGFMKKTLKYWDVR
jgi:hypothetical protein